MSARAYTVKGRIPNRFQVYAWITATLDRDEFDTADVPRPPAELKKPKIARPFRSERGGRASPGLIRQGLAKLPNPDANFLKTSIFVFTKI